MNITINGWQEKQEFIVARKRTSNGWLTRQAKKWTPSQRIIISKIPIAQVIPTAQTEPRAHKKPKGLWYAAGSEWVDWCRSEEPQWLDDIRYCYELHVVPDRVLSLSTPQQLDKFTNKFSVQDAALASLAGTLSEHAHHQFGALGMAIDWGTIAKQYGAVEIIPYCWPRRLDGIASTWYYGWDIASGCCWDPLAAESLELLATRPS